MRLGSERLAVVAAHKRVRDAGPDLLAALRGLLYRHGDASDAHGPWAEWDEARAAITKATGK